MDLLQDKDELLAVRYTGWHSKQDYDELYKYLVQKSKQLQGVYLYEEALEFGPVAFLSTCIGTYHDLKYGPSIQLEKHAIVSDSFWAWLMTYLFKNIRPVWPFSPTELRFFEMSDRAEALQWIKNS